MAQNAVYTNTNKLRLAVAAGIASGDPVQVGGTADRSIVGYALETRDANGNAVIRINPSQVVRMTVIAGTDDSSPPAGASAVARGDVIYKNTSTELLSKDSSGTLPYGIALGTRDANGAYASGTQVAAGETDACDILLLG